jgi:hypothetical protein
MARLLFGLLVLILVARIAQLEMRVAALTAESQSWPCRGLQRVPNVATRDIEHRLERAVRLVDFCDGRR